MTSPAAYLRTAYRRVRAFLRTWITLLGALVYDARRFVRNSGTFRKRSYVPSLGALITKQYHRIEKGLALPKPRPGFGEAGIRELCSLIAQARMDGTCRLEVALAVDALAGYRAFNLAHGINPQSWLENAIESARSDGVVLSGTPVRRVSTKPVPPDALAAIISRTSVRDFSDAAVPDAVLINAVRAAQHAPCVCNRQSGRIHLIKDPALRSAALSYQNGNRGFGELAPVVAIVTVDQSEMLEATERYQHWIDGGMFAQNFLLGIHVQGYGACPLNWSATPAKDKAIRRALGFITDAESIIMLVAIGAVKAEYEVARSERRPIEQVVNIE